MLLSCPLSCPLSYPVLCPVLCPLSYPVLCQAYACGPVAVLQGPQSVRNYPSIYPTLSLALSFYLPFSQSLYFPLYLTSSHLLSHLSSVYLCFASLSLSLLNLSPSVLPCLYFFISLFLPCPHPLSLSAFLSFSLTLSLCSFLPVSLAFSLCLYVFDSLYFFLFLSLSLPRSLYFSLSIMRWLSPKFLYLPLSLFPRNLLCLLLLSSRPFSPAAIALWHRSSPLPAYF